MSRVQPIERWRSTAFLLAGVLWLGLATSEAAALVTTATPGTWVNTLFVSSGLVAVTVGFLGLYPLLSDRAPRLTLVSAAVVTVMGVAAVALFGVVTVNGFVAGIQLSFLPVYFLTVSTAILGFALFGVGSLWTNTPSRTVGWLVLGPPTVLVIMLGTAPMNPPEWSAPLISAVFSVALLAIGIGLRTSPTQLDRTSQSMDSSSS